MTRDSSVPARRNRAAQATAGCASYGRPTTQILGKLGTANRTSAAAVYRQLAQIH
jgi:hypothetical protein